MSDDGLKKTPLYDIHVALGAKIVGFGGYLMPVSYPPGISAEHTAVRTGVGVFDVSHMGEFEITGPDRNAYVQRITCNDVGALQPGQVQYSALLTEQGTFVDDCLVYRFEDRVMLVVNASNIKKDWEHIVPQKGGANIRMRDISDEVALLAVQGPKAEALLAPLTSVAVGMIPYASALSRVPATRVKTASSSTAARPTPSGCGTRWWARAAASPAAWARATPCGSRPACRSTATTSTIASRRSKRASTSSCGSTRARRSWGKARSSARSSRGSGASWWGSRSPSPKPWRATSIRSSSTASRWTWCARGP